MVCLLAPLPSAVVPVVQAIPVNRRIRLADTAGAVRARRLGLDRTGEAVLLGTAVFVRREPRRAGTGH